MQKDQSEYKISHYFLVEADTAKLGEEQVHHYLKGNQLVTYSHLVIREEEVIGSKDQRFWPTLNRGVQKNMNVAISLVDTLKEEGVTTLEELVQMREGYLTKVLHTLAHLLDGFIGVDSIFYNLVEDSHRVTSGLRETIDNEVEKFWLIPVRTGMLEASVLHERKEE
ncbi:MAG: hypothetical protein CSB34_02155 [Desulfobulbus propionicus]|nr:MAG: hypothetical protein CSB34_02155 [Desulfobulbus propionicus]